MTEPGAGSDVAAIKTRAEKKGDEVGVKLIQYRSNVSYQSRRDSRSAGLTEAEMSGIN